MRTIILLSVILLILECGCQDQLDILDPNQPTPESAKTEQGVISLAQGALYINGFQGLKYGGFYFGNVINLHERMGDIVVSTLSPSEAYCPDNIILDDGTSLPSIHPAGQKDYLRAVNIPSFQANPFYFEWAHMYSLNGAMNNVLSIVDEIVMSDAKKNTIKAWAYFWKGFAYSRIGSMYTAGIINSEANKTNAKYVTKEEVLTEAETNFSNAESLLHILSGNLEYREILTLLVPDNCKVGKGFALTADEWLRHINTMRARNILVNTPISSMDTEWERILSLTSNGIRSSDMTFTIRTDALGNLLPANAFTAAQAIGPAVNGGGFGNKISERLIQEFSPDDNRFKNNFNPMAAWIGANDRGTSFNTRYLLVDKAKGMPGVVVMCDRTVGAHELYIAGMYEENVLMLAEANIYTGNVDAGLALIDELRNDQGAGLAAVAGTGRTSDQAKEELRRERRIALAFRGFAFYDARRWGVLKNGRTGSVVVDFDGTVNTNATIQYGYLEYWDVPVAEFFYNRPSTDSAPIVSPD
jgi:hypothetical protein